VIDVEASATCLSIQKQPLHSPVIGTTWSGTTDDDDGNPLRLSDRRSEGESNVRVRDQAPTQAFARTEPLVDILPDGRRRHASPLAAATT
jgi:hypothetical protein